jgi:hypothetical protein
MPLSFLQRSPVAGAVAIAAALLCAPASASVSVAIGEPGFYGRIDIGGAPPPRIVYREPVVVVQQPAHVVYQPIYLRVPPGHAHKWKQHCREYDACGRPVYFVQDDWYTREYAPHYREHHGHSDGHHDSKKQGKSKRHGHDH